MPGDSENWLPAIRERLFAVGSPENVTEPSMEKSFTATMSNVARLE